MMQFDPLVSPLLVWIFVICGTGFLLFLLLYLERSGLSMMRKRVKQFLNSLLFIALILFLLNPVSISERDSEPVLVISENLEKDELDFWKDSLGIQKLILAGDFESNSDSIILLGDSFSKDFLYSLRAKSIDWILPDSESAIELLEFKAFLRENEKQLLRVKLKKQGLSELSLFQEGQKLTSVKVEKSESRVEIVSTATVVGRNEWELRSDSVLLGTIRFFVSPSEPMVLQFQAGFPNPEFGTLSKYLKGRGDRVQEDIQLSRNTALASGELPSDSVDIYILDISQLDNAEVQKQFSQGASVLVINLYDAITEVKSINNSFGSNLSISPSQENQVRALENGLEILPYIWGNQTSQQSLVEGSIMIQPVGNAKMGVSLLNSSFPLVLSGDTLAYSRLWDEVLGALRPEDKEQWNLNGPVFKNQFFNLQYNGSDSSAVNSNSSGWEQSLINPSSKEKSIILDAGGWQKLEGGVEVFVSDSLDWSGVYAERERAMFLESKIWLSSNMKSQELKESFPFWAWGSILLILMTALWAEPKLFQ